MRFNDDERQRLLEAHGVGPRVIDRLEQIGISSLHELAQCRAEVLCAQISHAIGSSCWRNSPQARQSIQAAVERAQPERD
ncbi:MAG: helix-hairpin-helix domain-containing protein [Pseudomonadota bacterium]